ncbi:MAG: tetratricopeptide repeat protein [Acidobacteria bacterium]|nr:tetratricopeptide repeat protein [Acidobacteriota bacterium]
MAFGLGFDKNKILQAAEKYVLQGKLQAAIGEYSKILKKDPQDLMTLNTVGDLHARSGQNDEAIKCFYELAEKYLDAGYVARSIAVYKRITKLDSAALPALLKLGELYFTQGLTRDSRTHYLQAVELLLRRREKEQAREVFEKILLLDMENPRLQLRMAELYAETGKPQEALATYLGAAERFLDRHELEDAETALRAALCLDAGSVEGKTTLGRLLVEKGDYAKAVETLESIPSFAEQKGALNWLFHAYRKQGNSEKARQAAQQLFDIHEDFAGLAQICEEMAASGRPDDAFEIYAGAAKVLLAQRAFTGLSEGLQKIVSANPSHVKALELLWELQQQAGNRGEAQGTAEMLGHAYVEQGELDKASEVYARLVEQQPEDPELKQLLRQVEARLHGPLAETQAPPSLAVAEDLAAPGEQLPASEAALPPREQEILRDCLTESELYVNYHQIDKAIEVLERGLEEIPGNMALYEQLLPLYERARLYQKAANCAEALTEGYVRLGDGERAARYGELILTHQQKAQESETAAPEAVPLEAEPPPGEFPPPAAMPSAEESQVREIDLSAEWASLAGPAEGGAAAASAESLVEEIEFYLQAGLNSDAVPALGRLQEQSPGHPAISGFQERLGLVPAASAPMEAFAEGSPTVEQQPESSEQARPEAEGFAGAAIESSWLPSEAEPAVFSPPAPVEELEGAKLGSAPIEESELVPAATLGPETGATAAAPVEPEMPWDESLPPLESASHAPSFELDLGLEESHPAGTEAAVPPEDRLAELAGDLSQELEPSASTPATSMAAPAEAKVEGKDDDKQGFLDEVFAEFKDEVEEPAAATEGDIETHYNMGVAFKEMALYDEAIGEFQKAHQIAERKRDYTHVVQYCSLLANCFLEKGLPQVAVKWYQTALDSPGLDAETSMALLYEIGAANEVAGDRAAALRSFLEVYARNIDYRNVADRIRDLQ